MTNLNMVKYWVAGRDWNELRANEWHDGIELSQKKIDELKAESPHGIIVYWHGDEDDEDDSTENGHVIEW